MSNKSHKPDRQTTSVWIFLVLVFFYPIVTGLLLKRFILPHFLPAWHAGEVILVGSASSGFHQSAVSLSENFQANGWQVWIPQPEGQMVVGTAAIFYTLIAPQPWALLPFSALLHTIAAWGTLYRLRYAHLMTMVGLGAAGWYMLYEYWNARRIFKGKRFESTPVC